MEIEKDRSYCIFVVTPEKQQCLSPGLQQCDVHLLGTKEILQRPTTCLFQKAARQYLASIAHAKSSRTVALHHVIQIEESCEHIEI